ncbi:MAG: hypothetical protein KAR45_16125 [Desulfobacteraceae bacterium]|nr:hypothetical protein [Desulfobacteraceae bacterium]
MKPVAINLSLHRNIFRKVLLALLIIFVFTALGFTAVNSYNYITNRNIIKKYQSRVGKLKKQAQNKEQKKAKKEFDYLIPVIKNDLFSLPMILTEIEKNKPQKVDIHQLIFSENHKQVTIKGESGYVESVSAFLIEMEKSKQFSVKLIRQVITEDRSILFEINAEWKEDEKN